MLRLVDFLLLELVFLLEVQLQHLVLLQERRQQH
jgi:hypothetical protein